MKIIKVDNRKDLQRFINFPYSFYKNDQVWVPPLRTDLKAQFNPQKNPTLEHCHYALFLCEHDGRLAGRIAAFIDDNALDAWKEPIGLFGYYECIDHCEASAMLMDTASQWLRSKGMNRMRGPWSFVSQEWGLVVEGYSPSPTIMAPYNPPYYVQHFAANNFEKIKDLLVYYISVPEGYNIPGRILTLTDDVKERYGVSVRQVEMTNYREEVKKVIELSNKSLLENWGYTAVTTAEAEAISRDLKPVLHSRGVLFAEDRYGNAIGFAIAIPNANLLLKKMNGRLLPFGWLKLLGGLPKLREYRLFALGVLPEYHGKGVDSLLYRALYDSLYSPDTYIEINYVLEDNAPMNNAIVKLNAKPLRRYRIYEKPI